MEKTSLKPKKTKASKSSSMKLQPIIFLTFLSVALAIGIQQAYAQELVVLSHRFDESSFSSEIIGEIFNNDTRSYNMFDVDIIANLRDATGMLLVSEQGFIDAQRLGVGDSSAFNIFFLDEEIPETAVTYDLIVNDDRVVTGQPLNGDSDDDNNNISSESGEALDELRDLIGGNDDNDNSDPPDSCIPEYTIPCGGDIDMLPDPEESDNDNEDSEENSDEDESDNEESGGGEEG